MSKRLPRSVWLEERLNLHKDGELLINEPFVVWGAESTADGDTIIVMQCTRCRKRLGYRLTDGLPVEHCRPATARSRAHTEPSKRSVLAEQEARQQAAEKKRAA